MQQAGQLNKRVKLFKPAPAGTDRYGRLSPVPVLVREVWAAIRPIGSTEALAAAQLQSGQTHLITVRYHVDLAKAAGEYWFEFGGRVLNIVGQPISPKEARELLVFQVKEGSGHGH